MANEFENSLKAMANNPDFIKIILRVSGVEDFALQKISETYVAYLLNYIKENPNKKNNVIKALELLILQIKQQP